MHTTGLARRLALVMPAVLAAGIGLTEIPAAAAPEATAGAVTVTVRTDSGDLNVRSAPSATSHRVGTVRNGSRVVITCHARGTVFSGGPFDLTTNLWNRLADGGYVTDAMLVTGSNDPVVPPCATESTRPAAPRPAGATVTRNPAEEGTALWGALEKWYFTSGKRSYPAVRGTPRDLVSVARSAGWTVVGDPRARAMVVIPPGVLDAPDSGHVAWVDATSNRADGVYLRVTEMGAPGTAPHIWSGRTVKAAPGLSYIPAP
ncbi:amidase [Mycolicibacterium diernhoferi]|uniref:amidase n=1 Tax=Mycolicibacterium diernhoferi TaxID=1801 RepID=UPI001F37416B|nr:amidase [Mycolicibacterium diernhoferi]